MILFPCALAPVQFILSLVHSLSSAFKHSYPSFTSIHSVYLQRVIDLIKPPFSDLVDNGQGEQWVLNKRFSEFFKLYNSLCEDFGGMMEAEEKKALPRCTHQSNKWLTDHSNDDFIMKR